MSDQALRQQLKTLIAEIIEIDDYEDDDNFVTELGVDSVMVLEMVARIERRYRIRIPEERFADMQTLNAIVPIIQDIMQPAVGR